MKNIFVRFGIPYELVSYISDNLHQPLFAILQLSTVSTRDVLVPTRQANDEAESAIKLIKGAILKQPDILVALMANCSTSITATDASLAELLMDRRIRTNVPVFYPQNSAPKLPDFDKNRMQHEYKSRMTQNVNSHKNVRILPLLGVGDCVF